MELLRPWRATSRTQLLQNSYKPWEEQLLQEEQLLLLIPNQAGGSWDAAGCARSSSSKAKALSFGNCTGS